MHSTWGEQARLLGQHQGGHCGHSCSARLGSCSCSLTLMPLAALRLSRCLGVKGSGRLGRGESVTAALLSTSSSALSRHLSEDHNTAKNLPMKKIQATPCHWRDAASQRNVSMAFHFTFKSHTPNQAAKLIHMRHNAEVKIPRTLRQSICLHPKVEITF